MSKQLLCPSCKNAIVVDNQSLASADRIECPSCGSSFKLKKKPAPPPAPAPEVFEAQVVDVEPIEAAPTEAGPLDLGSMNFDNFGGMAGGPAATGFDPLADPLATGAPVAGAAPTGSFYAPTKVEVRTDKPGREPMSTTAKVFISLGSVGAILVLVCGVAGFLIVQNIMATGTDFQNMKLVALAMMNYESAYKKFPAPAAMDVEGKPAYSWTVTLMPYIDENAGFKAYDYGTVLPWNAPGNEALQGNAPSIYRSARGSAKANERNVFVLTAPATEKDTRLHPGFVEGRYSSMAQFVDGTSNSILLIQLRNHSKPWAEPGDLTIDEAYDLMQKEPGTVLITMADGATYWIPITIPREKFQALATRGGGEIVRIDELAQ